MFAPDELLKPLPGALPCGVDLAFAPEMDAIARARQEDDPTLAQGEWETALKEADWPFVVSQCADLIARRSKDLRLAVWLADAAGRSGGLAALAAALQVVGGLCDRFWDGLHPLPDEVGFEQRAGNLCWLAARLPALVAAAPEDGAGGARCLAALEELERVIDARLGADGPSLARAREALAGRGPGLAPASAASVTPAPGQAQPSGAPDSRAQALAQLREIAAFFRRTEPHSPVAYLADKAADWGALPLHVWLRAVVKDAGSIAHLEELLGLPGES